MAEVYNRVYSWKIDAYKYAYIVKINDTYPYYLGGRLNKELAAQKAGDANLLSESVYASNYNEMISEVKAYWGDGSFVSDPYTKYYNYEDNSNPSGNTVVILAGEDGAGSVTNTSTALSTNDYNALNDYIDKRFAALSASVWSDIQAVNAYVVEAFNKDVEESNKAIEEAKARLSAATAELKEYVDDAKGDLDTIRKALSDSDGTLSAEQIKALTTKLNGVQDWLNKYENGITNILSDYDALNKSFGVVGESTDVAAGAFSRFGECINVMSGTVGEVERFMVASAGVIGDVAKWYDESAETVSIVSSKIDAKMATIEDLAEYMDGNSATTRLAQVINAQAGTIISQADHSSSDGSISTITDELNAVSAFALTQLTYVDADGNKTYMKQRFDALNKSYENVLDIFSGVSATAISMRDTWTAESGKLSTVYEMVWDEETGTYTSGMGSFIKQTVKDIELAVSSGSVFAALNLKVSDDGKSLIYAHADEILLDGDVIAKSLIAKEANIGGVHIGNGEIWANNTSNGGGEWKLDSAGTLYATDAKIKGAISADTGYFAGAITATSLTLGGDYGGKSLSDYIEGKTGAQGCSEDDAERIVRNFFNSDEFKNNLASSGYVTSGFVQDYVSGHSLTSEQASALCNTLINAKITTQKDTKNADGSTTHTVTIGDTTYSWVTFDADDYVLLDTGVGKDGEGNDKFILSKDGLLTARNAIVYGTVYASEGYFIGSVSANSGYFRGDVYANNGSFRGTVNATSGSFKGSISATSGYFKGSISADSGYFKGEIECPKYEGSVLKQKSIMNNDTFKVSSYKPDGTSIDASISIQILDTCPLPGGATGTNVPVLCYYYSGNTYYISPESWINLTGGTLYYASWNSKAVSSITSTQMTATTSYYTNLWNTYDNGSVSIDSDYVDTYFNTEGFTGTSTATKISKNNVMWMTEKANVNESLQPYMGVYYNYNASMTDDVTNLNSASVLTFLSKSANQFSGCIVTSEINAYDSLQGWTSSSFGDWTIQTDDSNSYPVYDFLTDDGGEEDFRYIIGWHKIESYTNGASSSVKYLTWGIARVYAIVNGEGRNYYAMKFKITDSEPNDWLPSDTSNFTPIRFNSAYYTTDTPEWMVF